MVGVIGGDNGDGDGLFVELVEDTGIEPEFGSGVIGRLDADVELVMGPGGNFVEEGSGAEDEGLVDVRGGGVDSEEGVTVMGALAGLVDGDGDADSLAGVLFECFEVVLEFVIFDLAVEGFIGETERAVAVGASFACVPGEDTVTDDDGLAGLGGSHVAMVPVGFGSVCLEGYDY